VSLTLSEPAPAKVNLSLLVTGRRPDGYHLLDSLVAFGPAADIVHGAVAPGLSLRLEGPFAAGLRAEPDNLVLRAARALANWAGRPAGAALVLEKHLPVASGIGGGSADAAAALRLLCRLWEVDPGERALADIALGLGADVPVCLASRPARMTGIGEVLSPLPTLPMCGVLLANPGIAVATADVFRARVGPFSPAMTGILAWPDAAALAATLAGSGNDLEAPAMAVSPAIGPVLAALRALPGCLLARMSGSGATCFALFATPAEAGQGAILLPPEWWRSAGALYEPGGAAVLTGTDAWGVAKR
jgi:4-diphosphocytidyl-2-C-methyl-D-erythritol kinase